MMTSCTNSKKEENTKTEASSESTVSHTDEDKLTFTFNGEDIKLPCKLGDITSLKPAGIEEKGVTRMGYYSIPLKSGDETLAMAFCYTPDENDNDMSDDEVTEIMLSCFKIELLKDEGKDVSFSYMGGGADMKMNELKEKLGEPVKEEDKFTSIQGLDDMLQFNVKDGAVVASYNTIDGERLSTLGIYSMDSFSLKNAEERKKAKIKSSYRIK